MENNINFASYLEIFIDWTLVFLLRWPQNLAFSIHALFLHIFTKLLKYNAPLASGQSHTTRTRIIISRKKNSKTRACQGEGIAVANIRMQLSLTHNSETRTLHGFRTELGKVFHNFETISFPERVLLVFPCKIFCELPCHADTSSFTRQLLVANNRKKLRSRKDARVLFHILLGIFWCKR